MAIELRFPAPTPPLSINGANRMHWAQKRKQLAPWKEAARLAWIEQGRGVAGEIDGQRVLVEVTLPFAKKARRDPHNYTGTVVKAIVDGLIAGGMKPDDHAGFVSVSDPRLIVGGFPVVVRIEATGQRESNDGNG